MYRLIATDLDGTLLDDTSRLPETNMEYIQKAKDCGTMVALCSGRSYLSLNRFEERLGLNKQGGYGIAFNGGIVYDAYSKEIISDIRMERSLALTLTDELKREIIDPKVGMLLYFGADLYAERVNENSQVYADRSGLVLRSVDSFETLMDNPTKILLKGDTSTLRGVYEHMAGVIEGRCKMFFSSTELLEFIPLDSGKGHGLNILAERLGIPMSETIAVGDQVNDIEMLEAAGLGIAVANAVEPVKAIAGYVTNSDNNAGAFKEIVERFIL